MIKTALLVAFAAAFQFGQSSEEPILSCSIPAERQIDTAVEDALRQLAKRYFEDAERYYYNRTDLNGDGRPELLVYMVGRRICGSGGCSLFVLGNDRGEFRIVTRISLAHAPVIVSANRTNGWADLILYVRGGGISPGYYAVLQFDGKSYPTNPTVPPAEALRKRVRSTAYLSDADKTDAGIRRRP